MLNEISTLCSSLRQFNVQVQELHPWIKRLARSAGLIVGIDSAGHVGSVEYFDKQRAMQLPKIQESNHSNFPALNWVSPIWQLQLSEQQSAALADCPREDVRRRLVLLRNHIVEAKLSDSQAGVLSGIKALAQSYQSRFENLERSEEFIAFHVLIERLAQEDIDADGFFRKLTESALRLCADGSTDTLDTVEAFLIGEQETDGKQIKGKLPIFLDLSDCTRFECRVADPRMALYFSRCLNMTEVTAESEGVCAVTGERMALEGDKMPSALLPVLGPTILMSMNPDTPCHRRYGRTGTDIFSIGKKTTIELNSALQHLTSPERKNKNWQSVPARLKGKSNLLLVYLRSAPLLDAALAALFSDSEGADELYAVICEDVAKALEGRTTAGSDLLELFILNKISPGQVQVELSLSFTAQQVIEGAREWQIAAQNAPSCVALDKLTGPYPAQVALCLQSMWIRGGSASVDAPGMNVRDVYNLLVARMPGTGKCASALLKLALQRTGVLLMAIGHAAHRGEGDKRAWKAISAGARWSYSISIAVLAITLFKLGHRKDTYMQEPAFWLGRLLSLADTLHREYCKEVRNGDVPPQLIGNALIPTMTNDPNRGLARMRERIRIYQGWAATGGSGLARWSLAEMGKISFDLAQSLPERRMSDADQAQFLLGYLARSEKTDKEATAEGANQ
jgi:hypothetical protein